jgi:hypothetical protein
MSFNADAVILTLAILLAATVLGILANIVASKLKARRQKRDIAAISATIIDYFRRTGVEVSADCFRNNGSFTAVIESEPMKRFRLSHIIEMTVREHVRKSCGQDLGKIYWRFPIREAAQAVGGSDMASATEEKKPEELSDEYINEGLEHYRHIPKPEVTELPWETFEQMSTIGKKDSSH